MTVLPLSGIRVLDFTLVWAGPYATMMLADYGAEVIRVESLQHFPTTTRGPAARPPKALLANATTMLCGYPHWDPGERPWDRHPMFNCHARNKLSMTVDATRPEGREIIRRLVACSDVVVENNPITTMPHLGLDYDTVTHRECGTHRYPGMQWKMSTTPASFRLPPCCLGEHHDYVYRNLLGLHDDEITARREAGHIGDTYVGV